MKVFIFISLVFSVNVGVANDSIENYIGCYQTISINGKKITPGSDLERSQTKIETLMSSSFYDSKTKRPLKSIIITLFTGNKGKMYSYHSYVFFQELGEGHLNKETFNYVVDSKVFYKKYFDLNLVDHYAKLSIKKQGSFLIGNLSFQSILRKINSTKEFKIKKTRCY